MTTRRALLSLLPTTLAGCTVLDRGGTSPDSSGTRTFSWPSVNATPENTRTIPNGRLDELQPDPQTTYPADEVGINGSNARAPVVDDEAVILVAPGESDDDGCLVTCFEPDGHDWLDVTWQRELEHAFPDGAATIVDDLVLVTVSNESGIEPDTDAGLVALSMSDGETLWSYPLEDGPALTPTAKNGIAYMRTATGVIAVDIETGDREWRDDASTIEHPWQHHTHTEHFAPAVDEGRVYVSGGGELTVYDHNGAHQWGIELTDVEGGPAVDHGMIYICAGNELYALDAVGGRSEWTEENVRSIGPAVGDDEVVVSDGNRVLALDPGDGSTHWQTDNILQGSAVFSPSIVGETIVASSPSTIVGLTRSDGDQRWELKSEATRWHQTIADGRVYHFCRNGDSGYQLRIYDK
ncbi:PQQ-like domain-containing protein [Natronorubrum daqingense]|uniref:PQQ-like domain-containing protein n=1 Tax=Natronorubrum daqingense TaxID=588898 RepID=A0A1N7AQ93_9EURY|nr:PQQ-like domain-containing protein [Natronorubrum daqingense]